MKSVAKSAMGLFSNRISRDALQPGDHIYSWRFAYSYAHHGMSGPTYRNIGYGCVLLCVHSKAIVKAVYRPKRRLYFGMIGQAEHARLLHDVTHLSCCGAGQRSKCHHPPHRRISSP